MAVAAGAQATVGAVQKVGAATSAGIQQSAGEESQSPSGATSSGSASQYSTSSSPLWVEVVAGVWVLEHPQLLPLDLRELRVLHHRVVLALTISLSKTVVLLSLLLGQQVRVLLVVRMQALLR